jgi:hypothetical protein
MDGAIYVLSRRVQGDSGEPLMQNVTVFAESATEARALVQAEFLRLRQGSNAPERAYQPTPAFSVEKIALDAHKLITSGVTA